MSKAAAKTRSGARHRRAVPDDYLALVREFPLQPIRNDREYGAAAAILDRFAVRPEGTLTAGERGYFDTLTLLVQAYDAEKFKIETSRLSGLNALKYLMEQVGGRTADLGDLLGNRALASLILNGHRALSKTHIRILSDHFKVEPGLFLEGGRD